MKATYQVIYYVPNLILGGKFPIGALVHEDLATTFIKAKELPDQDCLGGARALLFMGALLRRLEAGAWHEGRLSHHIEYGHRVDVPRGIDKAPRRWVKDCLWPSEPLKEAKATTRAPSRGYHGRQFFKACGVGHLVQNKFTNNHELFNRLKVGKAAARRPITHYVEGVDRVLLMEPLVVSKATHAVKNGVSKVIDHLLPYSYAVSENNNTFASMFVYFVSVDRTMPVDLDWAKRELSSYAKVIDTGLREESADFVDLIRQVGGDGPKNLELPLGAK